MAQNAGQSRRSHPHGVAASRLTGPDRLGGGGGSSLVVDTGTRLTGFRFQPGLQPDGKLARSRPLPSTELVKYLVVDGGQEYRLQRCTVRGSSTPYQDPTSTRVRGAGKCSGTAADGASRKDLINPTILLGPSKLAKSQFLLSHGADEHTMILARWSVGRRARGTSWFLNVGNPGESSREAS